MRYYPDYHTGIENYFNEVNRLANNIIEFAGGRDHVVNGDALNYRELFKNPDVLDYDGEDADLLSDMTYGEILASKLLKSENDARTVIFVSPSLPHVLSETGRWRGAVNQLMELAIECMFDDVASIVIDIV